MDLITNTTKNSQENLFLIHFVSDLCWDLSDHLDLSEFERMQKRFGKAYPV